MVNLNNMNYIISIIYSEVLFCKINDRFPLLFSEMVSITNGEKLLERDLARFSGNIQAPQPRIILKSTDRNVSTLVEEAH